MFDFTANRNLAKQYLYNIAHIERRTEHELSRFFLSFECALCIANASWFNANVCDVACISTTRLHFKNLLIKNCVSLWLVCATIYPGFMVVCIKQDKLTLNKYNLPAAAKCLIIVLSCARVYKEKQLDTIATFIFTEYSNEDDVIAIGVCTYDFGGG